MKIIVLEENGEFFISIPSNCYIDFIEIENQRANDKVLLYGKVLKSNIPLNVHIVAHKTKKSL